MPTKIEEYSMYAPGKLVQCRADIYSTDPNGKINGGSVGLVLERDRVKSGRLLVQFVNNITWWVNTSEIEPYIEGGG
jgi:hypothetical protein